MIDYAPLYSSLTKEEKRVYHVYKDPLGIWTIGDGFNVDGDHGGGLDDDECNFILAHRVEKARALCDSYKWFSTLDETRQFIVIDMMYNMGPGAFAQFHHLHDALSAKDYNTCADQMAQSKWDAQTGKRADRLERIMRSGVWED